MKTFDYAAAWREVALPAYESLPQNVRDLLAQVAIEAAHLSQLPDLSMPWPDDPQLGEKRTEGSTLHQRFEEIPAEILAFAARVIHDVGHWFPRDGTLDLPGRMVGAHWKFSHYADQSLRARLITATSADVMRTNGPFQIHEGMIRLCYSSRDTWMWEEVAPATYKGLEYARALHVELWSVRPLDPHGRKLNTDRYEQDAKVGEWFEQLRARQLPWPSEWMPFQHIGPRYMREEQNIQRTQAQTVQIRAHLLEKCARSIAVATRKRDGYLWLHDRGFHLDNVIFYDHQNSGDGVFCFGWREPVTEEVLSALLQVISEFPYAYRIKAKDKTYEGGIG